MRAITSVALGVMVIVLVGCSHLVLLHDPLTAPEHTDLGVAYERTGQPALARREYLAALRRDRAWAPAWLDLGNLACAEGRWDAARRCYRRALELTPCDPDVLNNYAVVVARRGETEDARGFAARAVRIGGRRDSIYRATLAELGGAPAPIPVAP